MRRPDPDIRPERANEIWDATQSSAATGRTLNVRCKLVTPMYGGGVTAGEVDRDMPIRAGALRGQLRFWWRLLNGAGREPAGLFAAEADLWGGISRNGPRASRVALRVEGKPVRNGQLMAKSALDIPAYALIPERGDDPRLLKPGHEFGLALRFEQTVDEERQKQAVEALRWWASFGGVGARTRRGVGAVRVTGDDDPKPVSAAEVEERGGKMVIGRPANSPARAWKDAIEALRLFRQGGDAGRNPGRRGRPGRSRWPEADSIRRLFGTHAPQHRPTHPVDGFYPRAAFGLPLVFHFKDGGDPGGTGGDSLVLVPGDRERMASPLILRPWFDGRRYRPAALLLPGWEKRICVRVGFDSKETKAAWPEDIDERRQPATRIGPMNGRGTDALSAFMRFFEESTGGARP